MNASKHCDYAIVGQGAAGMAAAEAIRSLDASGRIVFFSDEAHRYYSRPGLAYLLTGQIPEKQLFPYTKTEEEQIDASHVHAAVAGLDPSRHSLHLENGAVFSFRKALLATGATAALPGISGIDLDGVVTLDTLDDARRILKKVRKARRAVVMGGGITALELAEGLAARGIETHYLLRRDRYWSNVLDEDEARLVEERLVEEGIQLHHNTQITGILGKKGHVTAVELDPPGRIECTIVAVAIGIRPRLDLAHAAGLETDRGILVDEHMRTSQVDVYAAGDVAQVYDPSVDAHVLDSLWWPAREQGRIAGTNMAGGDMTYQRTIPFNVTRIGGLTTTIIGAIGQNMHDDDLISIARGDSQTWRHRPDAFAVEADSELNRMRLIVGQQTILGALLMGDQSLSRTIMHLIREEIDIRPIREILLSGREDLARCILEFTRTTSEATHGN